MEKHYVVKFKARAAESWLYAPDDEKYPCDEETALARFHSLIESGRRGVTIYGLFVWHVRIEDVRLAEGPRGDDALKMLDREVPAPKNIMLSQYVDDDEAMGPWAAGQVAA